MCLAYLAICQPVYTANPRHIYVNEALISGPYRKVNVSEYHIHMLYVPLEILVDIFMA